MLSIFVYLALCHYYAMLTIQLSHRWYIMLCITCTVCRGWVLPYLSMVERFRSDDPHFCDFQSDWVPKFRRSKGGFTAEPVWLISLRICAFSHDLQTIMIRVKKTNKIKTHLVWVYFVWCYLVTRQETRSEHIVRYQLSLSSTSVLQGYDHILYTSAEFVFR